MHSTQSEMSLRCNNAWTVPGGHEEHLVTPADENSPAGHGEHGTALEAEYCPAVHKTQMDCSLFGTEPDKQG